MKSQSVVLAMLLVGCAAKGTAGPPGADGAKGMDGAQGPVGPAGPAGPAGPMGAKGPAGADGMPGAQGPIGMQGPAGMIGPAGPPGTPADVSKLVDLASAQTIAGAKTFSATVTATGDITANGYSLTAGQQNVRSIVNKAAANGFCPAGQTAIYTPWSMRGKTGAAICAADARGKTNCGAVKFVYVAADNSYGAYGPNDLGCTQTVDYPWPWGVDYQTPDTLDSEWSHGNTYVVCCF